MVAPPARRKGLRKLAMLRLDVSVEPRPDVVAAEGRPLFDKQQRNLWAATSKRDCCEAAGESAARDYQEGRGLAHAASAKEQMESWGPGW